MYYSPSKHKEGTSGFFFNHDKNKPTDAFKIKAIDLNRAINLSSEYGYYGIPPKKGLFQKGKLVFFKRVTDGEGNVSEIPVSNPETEGAGISLFKLFKHFSK